MGAETLTACESVGISDEVTFRRLKVRPDLIPSNTRELLMSEMCVRFSDGCPFRLFYSFNSSCERMTQPPF
jgi:hypothetical protein